MPSVQDIVNVAEALEKSPVAVVTDRCVAVRNRNASCRKCVQACPVDALEVGGNEVSLDVSVCTGCGACTTVCPTEALLPLAPTDSDLAAQAVLALQKMNDTVAFACARIASKGLADPATFVEVPCLPRVDEGMLVALASRGARDVVLVDGDCSTCKYHSCSAAADVTVAYANELLKAQGSATRVRRITGFPEGFASPEEGGIGASRREFFSQATRTAREAALTAAKTTIAQELGYDQTPGEIGERLRVTQDGTLPMLRMQRHEAAINALDLIGESQEPSVNTRLFGSVEVDTSKCNSCGMCAVFCPTGALRRDPADKVSDPLRYLEFSASDCVQCGLCVDVCWKQAVTLSPTVSTNQLFDFEPVTFNLPKQSVRKSFFG